MTLTDAPARPRPRDAGRASPVSLWRLLWLELRRNAMPWMFPLLAALFVFDPYRTAMSYPPLWDLRASVVVNKLLPDLVAFVAGVAAWMGSRDGRRHTSDLVTATARPRWTAWLVTWAATAVLRGFHGGRTRSLGRSATKVPHRGRDSTVSQVIVRPIRVRNPLSWQRVPHTNRL